MKPSKKLNLITTSLAAGLLAVGSAQAATGLGTAPLEGSWSSGWSGNDYNAVWTAVPEPAAALLGSLGMLVLLRRRR